MTYNFSRKRLVMVVAGLGLLIVLTYTAGVVTGIALVIPTRQELALLKASKVPTSAALPPAHLPGGSPSGERATPPVVQPAAPAPAPEPAPAAAAPTTVAAAPTTIAAAPATVAAAPAPPLAGTPAVAPGDEVDTFSLQIGSFRDAKNARQLQSDLKERGYTAGIFTALDAEQREWHVVRIDGYKTLASAARAAADFSGKERIPALVRRSNSL